MNKEYKFEDSDEYKTLKSELTEIKKKVEMLEKAQKIALQMIRGQHIPDEYYRY